MSIISRIYPSSNKLGPDNLAKDGPRIDVEVSITTELQQYFQSKNLPVPAPVKGMALIDTGATISCIDDTIASKLGINPTGRINSGGMSGSSVRNSYPVKLTILAGNQR